MKQKKKPYETDPLDLRSRRRRRQQRERRIKWLLIIGAILIIGIIAVVFGRVALSRMGYEFKAPIENPTFWYQQTEQVLFRTITPTPSLSPTPVTPSATLTPTATETPTVSPTPTLTSTPKLRPRVTVEGSVGDLLMQAESTQAAKNAASQKKAGYSDAWFELLGTASKFDAAEVYPDSDCTWTGVAGVLVDKRGDPQIGYYVQVGFADGTLVETISGLFPDYGDSGYELTLARPVKAFDTQVWIQILDENRQIASQKTYFRPSSDCHESLTMINFQRTK